MAQAYTEQVALRVRRGLGGTNSASSFAPGCGCYNISVGSPTGIFENGIEIVPGYISYEPYSFGSDGLYTAGFGDATAGATVMVFPGGAVSGACERRGCYGIAGLGEGYSARGSVDLPLFVSKSLYSVQNSGYTGGAGLGANATIGLPTFAAVDSIFGTSTVPYLEGLASRLAPGLNIAKGPVGLSATGFLNFSGGRFNGSLDIELIPAVGQSAVAGVGYDARQ